MTSFGHSQYCLYMLFSFRLQLKTFSITEFSSLLCAPPQLQRLIFGGYVADIARSINVSNGTYLLNNGHHFRDIEDSQTKMLKTPTTKIRFLSDAPLQGTPRISTQTLYCQKSRLLDEHFAANRTCLSLSVFMQSHILRR